MNEVEVYDPSDRKAWRSWLAKNHATKTSVWLVLYKKNAQKATISWREAVDEALCFGWIDSKKIKIDAESSHQYFSPRKAKSGWSKINKAKVQELIEQGLLTAAGLKSIETAKNNGSWNLLDDVEALIIPTDLDQAFALYSGSKDYFLTLSKSVRKMMLHWVSSAKKIETRHKRIVEIAAKAGENKKPSVF